MLIALTPKINKDAHSIVVPPVPCPDLQRISLRGVTSPPISDNVVFEFIKARREMATLSLCFVEYTKDAEWDGPEMDVIAELHKTNVNLRGVEILWKCKCHCIASSLFWLQLIRR